MKGNRRGFLGGLIALPFLAKATPPTPPPPAVITVVADDVVQRFAYRAAEPQNIGSYDDYNGMPIPPYPTIYQAWFNPSRETRYVAEAGEIRPIPPGESRYLNRRGEWVPCRSPRGDRA